MSYNFADRQHCKFREHTSVQSVAQQKGMPCQAGTEYRPPGGRQNTNQLHIEFAESVLLMGKMHQVNMNHSLRQGLRGA